MLIDNVKLISSIFNFVMQTRMNYFVRHFLIQKVFKLYLL